MRYICQTPKKAPENLSFPREFKFAQKDIMDGSVCIKPQKQKRLFSKKHNGWKCLPGAPIVKRLFSENYNETKCLHEAPIEKEPGVLYIFARFGSTQREVSERVANPIEVSEGRIGGKEVCL